MLEQDDHKNVLCTWFLGLALKCSAVGDVLTLPKGNIRLSVTVEALSIRASSSFIASSFPIVIEVR